MRPPPRCPVRRWARRCSRRRAGTLPDPATSRASATVVSSRRSRVSEPIVRADRPSGRRRALGQRSRPGMGQDRASRAEQQLGTRAPIGASAGIRCRLLSCPRSAPRFRAGPQAAGGASWRHTAHAAGAGLPPVTRADRRQAEISNNGCRSGKRSAGLSNQPSSTMRAAVRCVVERGIPQRRTSAARVNSQCLASKALKIAAARSSPPTGGLPGSTGSSGPAGSRFGLVMYYIRLSPKCGNEPAWYFSRTGLRVFTQRVTGHFR